MRKFPNPILVISIIALTIVGFGAIMASGPSTQVVTSVGLVALSADERDAIRLHAQEILDIVGPATTTTAPTTTTTAPTTTTAAPTTTTTAAPTTTTAPPTTTTQPPTTTTQPPTTTTTQPGPLPSPSGPRYDFFVNVQEFGKTWTAPYYRTLPYSPSTGWWDGNRDGYKCAFGILRWNNAPAGRVTFTRVAGAAAYTIINDKGMPDNGPTLRHYNTGLLTPTPVTQGECPPPDSSVSYEPSTLPGQLPVIDYIGTNGELLERRDYRKLDDDGPLPTQLKFRLFSVSAERVTVVAYWENNPFVVIYYDAPVNWAGNVTMEAFIP